MKQIIHIIIFLLVPLCLVAQSTSQNYILTRVYQTADSTKYLDKIQYFDGLGRPMETVQKAQSSKDGITWVDLVNITQYDGFGREYRHWLPAPATGSTGVYTDTTSFKSLAGSQYTGTEKPYNTTEFEPSPLNRVTGQYGAGAAWYANIKKTVTSYQTNTANEVIYFSVNSNNQLVNNGYYAVNTLHKTQVTDEDGKTTTEYKDMQGLVVMKRSSTDTDTYYIYNDLDQLIYVLSPEGSTKLSGFTNQLTMPDSINAQTDQYITALWQLAYYYQYDDRGNCKYKKLPGCRPIYMVYDKACRLVLSQDGNQRKGNKWTFSKYDGLGRVVQTGKTIIAGTSDAMITTYKVKLIVESYSPGTGYTNSNPFSSVDTLLTQSYYDTYDYQNIPAYSTIKNNLAYSDLTGSGFDSRYTSAKGLLTGTTVAMLDNSSTMVTAMYYDDHGRVVQTLANNHLNGYDYEYFHYNFTGQVLNKRHVHYTPYITSQLTENYSYRYDKANRMTSIRHALNTEPVILLDSMTYDELGRVSKKILHGGIQTINYTYNIRNWLKSTSSEKFTETLYYQDSPYGGSCYNGNISATTFGTGSYQTYIFLYDQLNRLTNATNGISGYGFGESVGSYDKNGNIQGIQREGYVYNYGHNVVNGLIDNLTLTYNGNQLKSVSDAVDQTTVVTTNDFVDKSDAAYPTEYLYDANGNQYADLNKGIAWIRYNLLNLPQKVQFRNGTTNAYLYDASGVKHQAKYSYSTSTSLIYMGLF